ncbi:MULTISPECIES: hypothetical protein [Flavobacterium]|uniref:hypothetical protein n=1 Tax=Flavobacterium TaxID=237 RepID=UPI001FCAE09D|nr:MULTISPECIES: hypothetical protein [Flavobacterium]UOK41632.1 hypothetical protein LZF87_09950 [Flavobacterium enshiense]
MNYFEKLKSFFDKYGKYIIIAAVLLILISTGKQFFYYKEIKDYKKETIGLIEDFKYTSRGSYNLIYSYKVNNENYKNTIGTSGFFGDNKRKGCIGCEFKVLYSSKDPKKSSIRLGKYEKYKRTVEFVDLDN